MASWTTLLNAIFLVGKPITSASGLALRDNPISIAEGAPGAPRVQGVSLGGISMGAVSVVDTTAVGYTNCDRMGLVRADLTGSVSADRILRARYSSNNGSTYGAWQNIVNTNFPGTDGGGSIAGSMRLNLQTGAFNFSASAARNPSSGSLNFLFLASGTHTVPAGCNAFQLSWHQSANTANFDFYCLGGIA
jgi:hypothetical protein